MCEKAVKIGIIKKINMPLIVINWWAIKEYEKTKNDNKISNDKMIGCHTGKWLSYYHVPKNEIIYNPKYHFYCNGFKFSSLMVIKKMKQNRNEPKDVNDLSLIKKFPIKGVSVSR